MNVCISTYGPQYTDFLYTLAKQLCNPDSGFQSCFSQDTCVLYHIQIQNHLGNMSLSTLPDLCLFAILDYIPLRELLHTIPLVSQRLYSLLPTACSRRKTLILLREADEIRLLNYHEKLNSFFSQNIINEDDTPFAALRPNYEDHTLVLPNFQLDPIGFRLTELFPNIATLHTIQFATNIDLGQLALMLQFWESTLTRLSLCFYADDPQGDGAEEHLHEFENIPRTEDTFELFFRMLNKLSNLKQLRLQLYTDTRFTGSITPDLAVLRQLERFHFHSLGFTASNRRDVNLPLAQLSANADRCESLCEIVIHNPTTLNQLLQCDTRICTAFTHLQIEDEINPRTLKNFDRFCNRFTSLITLTLTAIGNISIARLARSLAQLKLIHLVMHVNLDPAEDQIPLLFEEEDQVPLDDLPQLNSVKALSLYVTTKSHHDIRSLQLPVIFPNLQVILLRHTSVRCHECGYGVEQPNNNNEAHDEEALAECMRMSRRPLRALERLRVINVNASPDWLNDEQDLELDLTSDDL